MESIKELIYNIKDKQVLLDSDVAKLYGYDTKRINETVSRNKKRFPNEFCFQLTKEEYEKLVQRESLKLDEFSRSQIATAYLKVREKSQNKVVKRNKRYLPYAFTEQGIAMLSGLLKNDIAVQVSINIMNAFVEMRKFISQNINIFERLTNIEYKLLEHDNKFDIVFDALGMGKEIKQKIFYDGQIYDVFSLIVDIIKKADNEIIIIDNYIDKNILDILSYKNEKVKVILVTSQYNKGIINKYKSQYNNVKIIYSNKFHDRFIIIDNKDLYHVGSSFKDLGRKCFGINKIQNIEHLDIILSMIR